MKSKTFYAHKTSIIDRGAKIGNDTKIWHFSHIMKGAQIGKGCNLGQNVVVHPTVKIGNNVKIQNNVSLYDGVILENEVFCGPSCVFTNIINPRSCVPRNTAKHWGKILVKKGATIGANATIVCGVTIGKYAFIGAGAVVTKNIGDYELYYGNPSSRKGWMSSHGAKLIFKSGKATCSISKKKYKKTNNKVSEA